MKILHVITCLGDGGAEGVLYRLCTYDSSAKHIVVSLMDEGKYGPLLRKAGIEVHCLNMSQGRVSFFGLWQLFKLLRTRKPDVVQTWMYHADLIGGLLARLVGIRNIFWNIRQSVFDEKKSKYSSILVSRLCAQLSAVVPKRIICCGHEVMRHHSELGYVSSKMSVIFNGYDLASFNSNDVLATAFRREFKIEPETLFLGMVGRFDPQKDHLGLLRALYRVKNTIPDFKFALIGRDLNSANNMVVAEILKRGLGSNILLLDQRSDIPSVMNGLDIHILSSSYGEGFPNVLAEAMACGTPCISTNVGDSAVIIAETGWILPPNDPKALAGAIVQAIHDKQNNHDVWLERKLACRNRVVENFSLDTMIEKYKQVWST